MSDLIGIEQQPVSQVQWVERFRLRSNSWNPNKVAPPEMKLLKTSIIEDGWTQPIVVYRVEPDEQGCDLEVVDGFHRWTVSADPELTAMTDSKVPVVVIEGAPEGLRLATVRHNRARGTHYVLRMADLVAELVDLGMTTEEIEKRLGMEDEEVDRLLDRGNMLKRASTDDFGEAWRPKPVERAALEETAS